LDCAPSRPADAAIVTPTGLADTLYRRTKAPPEMSTIDTLPATGMPFAHCGPGETISRPRPGDIILVRYKNWLGLLIRAFARIRYRALEDRPYTHFSHVALVISHAGQMVEVNARGVVISHIRQYRERDYHYVWLDLPDAGRKAAVQFAKSCLRQKYSLRNFLLLAASIAVGDRIRMPDSGHGCVSLVVQALQKAGLRFERKPTDMTPADLAKRFGVTP
jgi:uncharacterized protein YycO